MEIVKILLKDQRVDPAYNGDNSAIKWASFDKHIGMIKLLLKDKRVRKSLMNSNTKWIKNRNEESYKLLEQYI